MGVIPTPLWLVLFFTIVLIFGFMLLFADSSEPRFVQAMLIGSVMAVLTAMLAAPGRARQPVPPWYRWPPGRSP